ncbi:MAG: sulfatase-like hydrolase/transferase, partial [bacterium]
LDGDVGRLLEMLEKLDIEKETIIFFTSDNGPHAEGGNDPQFFGSSGGLRGIKRDLYEGGIRVPMIVRWKGRTPAGSTSDYVGYFGDLMATAADLASVPPPESIDSVSFLPAILGDSKNQNKHEYLYWEFYEGGSAQAVRLGKWKAIRQPMFDGAVELYDLSQDPGEKSDLAIENPHIVSRLTAAMEAAHKPSQLWRVEPPEEESDPIHTPEG